MIIDVHTHISKLKDSKFSESYAKNAEFLLDEMKDAGTDLSLVLAGYGKDEEFNLTTANLVKEIAGREKLKAIASVDILNYQTEDLEELEGFLKNKQILGIKLYTGYQHFYPADQRCRPIYELCQKYNVPVIFHSGDTLAGYVKGPKVKYSHPLNIDEVAADLPNLKIVIAHMGNPWLIDCAELLYKNPNVYADISGLVASDNLKSPYGKLMKKRIEELADYSEHTFKLMYGTDWALCPMRSYLKFVKKLDFTSEQMDKLFYKNAQEVFNLK